MSFKEACHEEWKKWDPDSPHNRKRVSIVGILLFVLCIVVVLISISPLVNVVTLFIETLLLIFFIYKVFILDKN